MQDELGEIEEERGEFSYEIIQLPEDPDDDDVDDQQEIKRRVRLKRQRDIHRGDFYGTM